MTIRSIDLRGDQKVQPPAEPPLSNKVEPILKTCGGCGTFKAMDPDDLLCSSCQKTKDVQYLLSKAGSRTELPKGSRHPWEVYYDAGTNKYILTTPEDFEKWPSPETSPDFGRALARLTEEYFQGMLRQSSLPRRILPPPILPPRNEEEDQLRERADEEMRRALDILGAPAGSISSTDLIRFFDEIQHQQYRSGNYLAIAPLEPVEARIHQHEADGAGHPEETVQDHAQEQEEYYDEDNYWEDRADQADDGPS